MTQVSLDEILDAANSVDNWRILVNTSDNYSIRGRLSRNGYVYLESRLSGDESKKTVYSVRGEIKDIEICNYESDSIKETFDNIKQKAEGDKAALEQAKKNRLDGMVAKRTELIRNKYLGEGSGALTADECVKIAEKLKHFGKSHSSISSGESYWFSNIIFNMGVTIRAEKKNAVHDINIGEKYTVTVDYQRSFSKSYICSDFSGEEAKMIFEKLGRVMLEKEVKLLRPKLLRKGVRENSPLFSENEINAMATEGTDWFFEKDANRITGTLTKKEEEALFWLDNSKSEYGISFSYHPKKNSSAQERAVQKFSIEEGKKLFEVAMQTYEKKKRECEAKKEMDTANAVEVFRKNRGMGPQRVPLHRRLGR